MCSEVLTIDLQWMTFNEWPSQELAKFKARNLQLENDLNKMRSVVKQQQEELKTSVDNVLNLSGELREKGVEMAQVEEQNLL